MKVALLFFGQPRFVDNPEIERVYKQCIIDKYDTDVFCHAWWEDGTGKEYDYSSWSKINKCPIPENALELICEKYQPLFLIHDEPRYFELPEKAKEFVDIKFTGKHPDGNHWNHKNYSNVMSQLWSIKTIANAFDTYRKTPEVTWEYDWVILARYDTVLLNFPDLTTCNNRIFYLPGHHPRFPDTIQFFGPKFLNWAKNVYDDVNVIYESIWEPSPEAFKMGSFLSRYPQSDLAPCSMDANCIRS